MKHAIITILVVAAFCGATACRQQAGGGDKSKDTAIEQGAMVKPVRKFIPALPPSTLNPEEHRAYMVDHYWDKFDFSDTLFIAEVDTSHMATAFAIYAAGYVPDSLAHSAMSRLMQRASTSRKMFDYFMMLSDMVLHDPNSPLRNDEKYIPVLEQAVKSPYYDEYERMPYEFDLKVAMQNRVGHKANDFVYTLASERSARMHSIKADYLLIFISNPGCPMCREIREQLMASPMLNELSERGKFKVLVIYPDSDLVAWREHLNDYPASWINAYDKGGVITRDRLYDLKAIPALYLLDSEKMVMAKDCTDVEYVEHLISEAEII
ncbi:MAG: DUF5106 domain-containing protein [Alistipes sp.]|nr:DUF5106 domain-containing protein [Alistipes sp.]